MKFFTLVALVCSVLLVDNTEAAHLQNTLSRSDLAQLTNHQATIFAQLSAEEKEKGWWNSIGSLFNKAKSFVGGIVKKVAPMIQKVVSMVPKQVKGAQLAAKTFVNDLNKDANGKALAQLPSLSAAEMKTHGFDLKSFAQMNANKLTDNDIKQIILLGLAKDDLSKGL